MRGVQRFRLRHLAQTRLWLVPLTCFFLYCYFLRQTNLTLATTGALLSAALAGACAGFLPHNFHPARLFMGDSGSMLIGLVLSASALTLTGQFVGDAGARRQQPAS